MERWRGGEWRGGGWRPSGLLEDHLRLGRADLVSNKEAVRVLSLPVSITETVRCLLSNISIKYCWTGCDLNLLMIYQFKTTPVCPKSLRATTRANSQHSIQENTGFMNSCILLVFRKERYGTNITVVSAVISNLDVNIIKLQNMFINISMRLNTIIFWKSTRKIAQLQTTKNRVEPFKG